MTVNCHVTLALLSSNNVISRIVLWKRENENKKGEIINTNETINGKDKNETFPISQSAKDLIRLAIPRPLRIGIIFVL